MTRPAAAPRRRACSSGGRARWSGRPGPRCGRGSSAGRRCASRRCPAWGAAARPTTGRCSPRSRRRASSARPGGSRSPRCRSGAGFRPWETPGRPASARTSTRSARRARRASSTTGRAAAAGSAESRPRRRSPCRRPRSRRGRGCRRSAPGGRCSRARRPARGNGADRRSAAPPSAQRGGSRKPPPGGRAARRSRRRSCLSTRSCSPALRTSAHGVVATSSTDCNSSGFTWPSSSAGTAARTASISFARSRLSASRSINSSSIPIVNGGPLKLVFEHLNAVTARCQRAPWACLLSVAVPMETARPEVGRSRRRPLRRHRGMSNARVRTFRGQSPARTPTPPPRRHRRGAGPDGPAAAG